MRRYGIHNLGILSVPEQGGGVPGINWILRDEFTDTRAAGSVNGTDPTPGPGGTRDVVDANNTISIGSGILSKSGASAAAWEGIKWDGLAYHDGLVFLTKYRFTNAATNTARYSMFNSADSHTPNQPAAWGVAGAANHQAVYDLTALTLFALGTNTWYVLTSVTGTNRLYLFIKGGAYATWELAFFANKVFGYTDPTYPVQAMQNNATHTWDLDYVRIPDATWLPNPLAYDSFTRANGAIGSTESTGPDGQGAPAETWLSGASTWTVSGNEAINTPTPGSELLTNPSFANWTADDPDGWTVVGETAPDPEVCQVASGQAHAQCGGAGTGAANMYTTGGLLQLTQNVQTVGYFYQFEATVSAALSGAVNATALVPAVTMNAVSSYSRVGRASNAVMSLTRSGSTDITLDDVSLKLLPFDELITAVQVSADDVVVSVELDTISAGNGQGGLCVSLDDKDNPQNFALGYHDGTRAQLYKYVAGVATELINAVTAYAAGATMVIVKSGTSYSLYYNNAQVGTTQTIADAGIISNTLHGMFSTNSTAQLDNFQLMARGTDGEYGQLNTWSFD